MLRPRSRDSLAVSAIGGAVLVWLCARAPLAAADWPEWRGKGRIGVWTETGIADRLPASGLTAVWRTPVNAGDVSLDDLAPCYSYVAVPADTDAPAPSVSYWRRDRAAVRSAQRNPSRAVGKFARFGKIAARLASETPNQPPSVAAY